MHARVPDGTARVSVRQCSSGLVSGWSVVDRRQRGLGSGLDRGVLHAEAGVLESKPRSSKIFPVEIDDGDGLGSIWSQQNGA
jgi:hypothetical protein